MKPQHLSVILNILAIVISIGTIIMNINTSRKIRETQRILDGLDRAEPVQKKEGR